ncbi:MAG: AI-2E family transporter [Candidatus Woesearchaeota archaeon]|nr:AI-2E family transporter [Candidatus Woesearchaeota archaeon]
MKQYMKYAFLLFFFGLLILSFLIIRPFLTAILSGCIAVYIFYPLFRRLNRRLDNRTASSAIMLVLILILLVIFSILIGSKILSELGNISLEGPFLSLDGKCSSDTALCKASNYAAGILQDPRTNQVIFNFISDISKSIIISIPSLALQVLIFIFTTYYLFRDGEAILKYIGEIMPLKKDFKVLLKKQTEDLFYSTVYGAIIVSMIQGVVATAAFIIFNSTQSPFFWGALSIIAAMIPFIGTALIWMPMSLFQIYQGYLSGSTSMMWQGIGLFIVGLCLISTIDNMIKPKIVGKRAGMHPLLILLGALGGIALLDFIGVFIGPLILAFFISFLEVYKKEKSEIFNS